VVETGGLENRFTLTGNGGSNPSPSAISLLLPIPEQPKKLRPSIPVNSSEQMGRVDRTAGAGFGAHEKADFTSLRFFAQKRHKTDSKSSQVLTSSSHPPGFAAFG
jgi:hypothetical protein